MRGLEREYGDLVTFTWVNILIPDSAEMMDRYGFSATPEFYLVDGQGSILAFWDEPPEGDDFRLVVESKLTP